MRIFKNELIKGTAVLFIALNIFNFLNLIFNFLMGRMLGPAGYGVLATLMSFIYIYAIPSEAIQTLVAKYASKFKAKKEENKTKYLMKIFLKRGVALSIILFLLLMVISIFLSDKLGIDYWLIILINLTVFVVFIGPVTRGIMQGRKKFGAFGYSFVIESLVKVVASVLLVYFGFGILGAVHGVLLGIFVGLLLSFYFCKDIIKRKSEKTSFVNVKATPYFIVMWAILLLFSMDIIFAKYFFSADLAGKYAVISIIGKIIYLGTNSISKSMFPFSAERKESGESSSNILFKSLGVTLGLSLIGIIFYFLIPNFIVNILYGQVYLEIAKYIAYSGIAFMFLSLSNIILMYQLSIDEIKRSWIIVIPVLIQIGMFILWHSTIEKFLFALIISNVIMFIFSFLFFRRSKI